MSDNYNQNSSGQQPGLNYGPQGQYPPQQPQGQYPPQQPPYTQQIIINQPPVKKNGLGTAGFVLALLALVFCWIPILDFILWLLGAIFSVIGLFKAPRGLAIAGTVISFFGIIVLILFFGALIGIGSSISL